MAEYWVRWDPTNKKWEVSVDGGGFADLVENPTIEKCTINGGSAPSGVASKGVLFFDSTEKRTKVSEDNDTVIPVVGVLKEVVVLFSSGQGFGTSETELTSYGRTVGANKLRQGDTILLQGQMICGTVAGTKTLRLYVGSSSAAKLAETTGTTSNGLMQFWIMCYVRSTSLLAVTGFALYGTSEAVMLGNFYVNKGLTVDFTASQLFKLTGQHTGSAGDALLTDYSMTVIRGGKVISVV